MAKREKNILLVSLENLEDGIQYRYYYNNDEGNPRYCNSILRAEVATKYILSKVHIDEIVAIGSGATYDEGDQLKKTKLSDSGEYLVSDITTLSEYSLYRYRLTEFLDGIDLEEHEILEGVTEEEKEALIGIFNKFYLELRKLSGRKRKDTVFDKLRKEPQLYDRLVEMLPPELKDKEPWLKRYMYSILTDSYKLRALESNENVVISFIPTAKQHDGNVDLKNISNIIDAVTSSKEETVNLYIDMQGLERTEDFTMITVFSILKNEWKNKIHIKNILSSSQAGFAGEIKDERDRYEMNDLLAGMNAFIQYGKVGSLLKYWEERNVRNDHVERLLFAMQYVDDGVSLCNIDDLEYGVSELRKVLAEERVEEDHDLESNIIGILESGIRRDFGVLMEGDGEEPLDVLELAKWTYRKEFYQQTLTLLESKIPQDFVERGILYYAENEEDAENAIDAFCKEYVRAEVKDRYKFNDINHYFVKIYGRWLVKYRQDPVRLQQDFARMRAEITGSPHEKLINTYTLLDDKKELEELLYAYSTIGFRRNQVSHGKSGVKRYPGQRILRRENDNIRMVKEAVEHFFRQYSMAKAKLEGKENKSILVTGDQVKDKADRDRKNARRRKAES